MRITLGRILPVVTLQWCIVKLVDHQVIGTMPLEIQRQSLTRPLNWISIVIDPGIQIDTVKSPDHQQLLGKAHLDYIHY